ncbi:hypothetical protein [Acinetobacter lactucae]|uniref:hypothetical protein n=1 Tax=Acinetobacter lactucae TaxID=1785128 RepID=UPI0007077604|nr:hypothetical protein [Acinetobacter lactucae]KQE92183.1 hypothetical protein APB94_06530 [Acinetobacter lactucae]
MNLDYFGFGVTRFIIVFLIGSLFSLLLRFVFSFDSNSAIEIGTYLTYILFVYLGYIYTRKSTGLRYLNSFFLSFLVTLIFIIICIAFGYFDLNGALRSLLLYLLLMQLGTLIFLIKTKFIN